MKPGDKLGPYEILALVGKGGMGEVYRAHDPRLNRDVAIKVADSQFSERFTREARAIAALNHTNICHLYDVGPNYLVMEYVEGPDLRGPLDFDEALPIIQQLIDGIEAAHEKNIIHRDLKPANIKITPEGVVKILDFGLSKAMEPPPPSGGNPDNSPTLTMGATAVGTILGTASYMAPEQAKGKQADKRSDIWSFGVILYEVLTGKKLFPGETAVEILGGVLNKDPDLSAAPQRVHKLLRWCLEKDRKQRLASISDARRLLSESEETDAAPQLVPTAQSRLGRWVAAAATLAIVAAVGLAGWYRATRPIPLKPLTMFEVDLGPGSQPSTVGASAILSPDGQRFVYVSNRKLYTRELDELTAKEIAGTDGAVAPFFSPDGKWVGFFTTSKLKKIEVDGGAAIDLCDSRNSRGGTWGENGLIAATLDGSAGPVMQISENGGTPVALTRLEDGEISHRYPQMLPGGKAVLYTASVSPTNLLQASIVAMTLADHKQKVLQRGGGYARYVPTSGRTGHLTFISNGALYAVPFDPQTLETRGTPVRVLDGVAYSQTGTAEVSFADNPTGPGTLVYRKGGGSTENQVTMQWLDSSGKAEALPAKPDAYMYLRLSPGGDRVAYSVTDTWAYDMRRDTMTRLSFDNGQFPLWTPDGRFVVFRIVGKGLFWTRADGGGKPQLLVEGKNQLAPTSFTPDGKTLVYQQPVPGAGYDLLTVPVEISASGLKAGKPAPLLRTKFNERHAAFSPDGHWVAYSSDESGAYQIFVRPFPDNGSKWQVSNDGGVYPRFSGTGHELFYRNEGSSKVFVVNYAVKGESFVTDKPKIWLEKQLVDSQLSYPNYDVAPDGKRILALMPVESPESQKDQNHIIFVENFFDELKRKVPIGK